MDQIKIGKFIADMRKTQGLTQKELAEKLGLSDKTISKWECGNGMPDNSIMLDLCTLLQINVNELLSGERLSSETYSHKAEENIMNLIQETDVKERNNQRSFISTLIGEIALIVALWFILLISGGVRFLYSFVDFLSLFIILGTSLLVLLASGMLKDFFFAFRYFYKEDASTTRHQLMKSFTALKTGMIAIMLSGMLGVITPFIVILHNMSEPSSLGPNIATMCVCIFYSALINLLLLPIALRLKNRINEGA